MDGSQLGEFRIISKLGSGAMGAVYLAERDGDRVALKILHSHLLERHGFLHRFEREAAIGLEVDDPHVVRVLDYELLMPEEGDPHCLLVMEYVEGRTLRELFAELGPVPEALLREIGAQIATGLAAIHDNGIIHRDIKPENVLITADHRVRIMDLGVAKSLDDSLSLTGEGHFAGTLPYASPEQLSGKEVVPASDLYSLGVVLYELATGTNPFRREDAPSSIAAHLNEVPPPARNRNPEISDFLTALLECLLAKTVAERIASAAVLAEILEGGEGTEWWAHRSLSQSASLRPRVPVRRETRLLGRDAQQEQLSASWSKAQAGTGAVVLVEGEAGIGKSRLIDAFLEGIEESAEVLYGSYSPSGGHGGLSEAVTGRFGEAGLTDRLAPYLTVTPSLVPGFAALLKGEPPPDGAASLTSDAVHTVFCRLARGLAEERPMVWVVEDLHFASEDSRKVVLSLARVVAGRRILLLLTARAGLSEVELEQFGRVDEFRRVPLGRLSPREVVDLLRDALKSEALAEKLGGKVAHKSDGIPFIIFEILRGLRDGQFITELPDGTWVESKVVEKIEIPSAVRDLIEVRLAGLTEQQRQILDAASVAGYEFDPDLVARALRCERIIVLQQLAAMERGIGLVCGMGGTLRFDHHLVQEILYANQLDGLREEYHAAIGNAIEAQESALETDPEELTGSIAVDLASHFLIGHKGERAKRYLGRALDRLMQDGSVARLLEITECALHTPGLFEGKERAKLLLRKAGGFGLAARREEEVSAARDALEVGELDQGVVGEAQYALGRALLRTSQTAEAETCFRKAIRAAREAGDRKGEGRALGALGHALNSLGRVDEAMEKYRESLQVCQEIGDRLGEAISTMNMAMALHRSSTVSRAEDLFREVLDTMREIGDRPLEAATFQNLSLVLQSLGRRDEALEFARRSQAINQQIGNRWSEASCAGTLGGLLAGAGRFEQAEEAYERQLRLAREVFDRQMEAQATASIGVQYVCRGRLAAGLAHLERSLAIFTEMGDRGLTAWVETNIGAVYTELGNSEEAEAHLKGALAFATEAGDEIERGYALMGLGRLAECRGDASGAERYFQSALEVRRQMDHSSLIAASLLGIGGLQRRIGDCERARSALREARDLARIADTVDVEVMAVLHLGLIEGETEAALSTYAKTEARLDPRQRIDAKALLWQATEDVQHLEEAHCLLGTIVDHAPEEYRDSMIENVPLHRDIMAAWEEHSGEKE